MDIGFNELQDRLDKAKALHARLGGLLDVPAKQKKVQEMELAAADPGFWSDTRKAKAQNKALDLLKKELAEWTGTGKAVEDAGAHLELAVEAQEQSEIKEVAAALSSA